MAGTLTVQNLQGPSSGANANKIIVPSGQTLEVAGITGLSSGNIINVVDYSYTPPNWSYSVSSGTGANAYGTTFTLPKRSFVMCSAAGHVDNTSTVVNTLIDIDIDGDITWSMVYPYYKGQYYYTPSANGNTWAGFTVIKNKELSAGSHTVSIRVSAENSAGDTSSINGSTIRILALELI